MLSLSPAPRSPRSLARSLASRDALIAQGIIEAPVTTPPSPERALPSDADLLAATLSLADEATLRTLADETQDDDEHALFLSYRARRLAELQATERKARFGALVPISRADWAKEVTEGSRVPEPGTEEDRVRTEAGDADEVDGGKKGTGVVVCLYKDGFVPSPPPPPPHPLAPPFLRSTPRGSRMSVLEGSLSR